MAGSHLEIQAYKHCVLPVPKGKANLLRVIYDSSLSVISSSMRADVPRDTNKYSKGTCCLLMTEHRETGTHFHYPSLGPSYVRIQLQLYLTHLLPKETFSGHTTRNHNQSPAWFSPSLRHTKANLSKTQRSRGKNTAVGNGFNNIWALPFCSNSHLNIQDDWMRIIWKVWSPSLSLAGFLGTSQSSGFSSQLRAALNTQRARSFFLHSS